MKKKSIAIIAIIVVSFLILIGICLTKESDKNFTRQEENVVNSLTGGRYKNSFVECVERKLGNEGMVWVYLLGALKYKENRRSWNLILVSPESDAIGPGLPLEAGSVGTQSPVDIDDDGSLDEIGLIDTKTRGDYVIIIEPEQKGILSMDTYGLQMDDFILAKDIPYSSNALDRIYILRSTETGIIPIVPASVGCRDEYK